MKGDDNCDQRLMNRALTRSVIKWQEGRNVTLQTIDGECPNGLRVTVLPMSKICRRNCVPLSTLKERSHWPYVWHILSEKKGEMKKEASMQGNTWWLRQDWKTHTPATSNLNGIDWLLSIYNQS